MKKQTSDEKKAGIREIAQKLNVSTATVSRALRPETAHLVKESRRNEILELAHRMQFRRNPGARLIQKGQAPVITVVIPTDEDVFFSEFYGRLLSGVLESVAETEWDLRIATLNRRTTTLVSDLKRIALESSGLIYAGRVLTTEEISDLRHYQRPLVVMKSTIPPNVPLEQMSCNVAGVDNREGAGTAAKYLTQLGHSRFGVIAGPSTSRDFSERLAGYRSYFDGVGLALTPEQVFEGSYNQDTGREGCAQLLGLPTPPTALLCANDAIAFGALDQVKSLGLRCPEDISIIGFDDGPWALAGHPTLTTVRQPLRQLAERSVQVLINKVVSAEHPEIIEFPTTLSIRDSTAICAQQ